MLDEWKNFKMQDFRNLRDLLHLLRENEEANESTLELEDDKNEDLSDNVDHEPPVWSGAKNYKSKSLVYPALTTNTHIWAFVKQTTSNIERLAYGNKHKTTKLNKDLEFA